MAIDIGTVVINQPNRTTITSPNYRPKPNVAFAEINDVSTDGLQDGFTIIFSAANNRYETKSAANLTTSISIFGGYF